MAGSTALFWISAFIGSKHRQRYPPPSSVEQRCTDPGGYDGRREGGETDSRVEREGGRGMARLLLVVLVIGGFKLRDRQMRARLKACRAGENGEEGC